MVSYPDLGNLSTNSTIGDLMAFPNASYPYFWAWIFVGLWFIITSTLYFKEKERLGKQKLLSAMSVSCLVILMLSTIGSILGIISLEIMTYILVLSFLIIGIWFFSTK